MRPTVRLGVALVLILALAGCKKKTDTEPSGSCCFTQSGTGNTVFLAPANVNTVRVTGTFTGNSSNFVIWVGPQGAACDLTFNVNCSLLVNELLGTSWGKTSYTATLQTAGKRQYEIVSSTGVAWTITQVP